MKRPTVNTDVYLAIVWALEQVIPEIPKEDRPQSGYSLMVDYQEVLERKKEVIREILLEDSYEEFKRRNGMGKSSKSMGNSKPTKP